MHDFCESLSAGNIDGHHCHHLFSISDKPAAAKISLPIVQAEEHAHQPSMGGNHKSGKVFESQTGANPSLSSFVCLDASFASETSALDGPLQKSPDFHHL